MDTTTNGGSGQIFQTDYTGDGSIGDPFPGTNPGAFMRQYNSKNLSQLISKYNSQLAGTLTPAGQTLVKSGLITAAADAGARGCHAARQHRSRFHPAQLPLPHLDANFTYPIRLKWLGEGTTLEPGVAMYNVANFGNYTLNNYDRRTCSIILAPGDTNYPNGPFSYSVKDQNRVSSRFWHLRCGRCTLDRIPVEAHLLTCRLSRKALLRQGLCFWRHDPPDPARAGTIPLIRASNRISLSFGVRVSGVR